MIELRERKYNPKFGRSTGRFDKAPEPRKDPRAPLEFTPLLMKMLPFGLIGGAIYYVVSLWIG